MKRSAAYNFIILPILFLLLFCNQESKSKVGQTTNDNKEFARKPSSSYRDTLEVTIAAAIFFQPDTFQLKKIKAITNEGIFKAMMHEYAYQIKYSHSYMKIHWPGIELIDTERTRFIFFKTAHGKSYLIDLDLKDPSGMFVFDGSRPPLSIDMTNIKTQVQDYFSAVHYQ